MTGLYLTAYERVGKIRHEDYIEAFIDEELEVTEDMIGAYNEYLSENGFETYYDDMEMMLEGFTALEIARMTFYGDFNFSYEYHKFNGYGNLDSFEAWDIVKEMKNDAAFLRWYVEENDLIDWETAEEEIEEADRLLAAGY